MAYPKPSSTGIEELELQYEIKNYKRNEERRAPEELRRVHPLGKAPVITDGTVMIAESGANVEYLITKYGVEKFTPSEAGKIDDLYLIDFNLVSHFAEGTFMAVFVNKITFTIIPQKAPILLHPLLKIIFGSLTKKLFDSDLNVNAELKRNSKWIAGGEGPTSADFTIGFPLEGSPFISLKILV
ncbi:hypothetical protein M422DRAFT_55227 [Sphaerobolus stellatus SS14]|uniref:GST N-terminal domain-containing protein n=1 Tax=Sphaerobolus stellatus (strain SS14) TaxID=990650 RepID=A0A0C9UDA0_SPHS4|nr:hypothetical protein M422DRAFT_55227 [Sphaerobolus stellatus SS14]